MQQHAQLAQQAHVVLTVSQFISYFRGLCLGKVLDRSRGCQWSAITFGYVGNLLGRVWRQIIRRLRKS